MDGLSDVGQDDDGGGSKMSLSGGLAPQFIGDGVLKEVIDSVGRGEEGGSQGTLGLLFFWKGILCLVVYIFITPHLACKATCLSVSEAMQSRNHEVEGLNPKCHVSLCS
jgi:hypothetical protein